MAGQGRQEAVVTQHMVRCRIFRRLRSLSGHDQMVTYSPDPTFEGPLHTETCPMPKEYNSAEAVVGESTRQ